MKGSVEAEIRGRIARDGRMTFADFMELALYHPLDGYYSRKSVDPHADYYTSPAAHPAFGALIAVQLWGMWAAMDRPPRFHVLEVGAGSGLLGRDIVRYASHLPPAFLASLSYVALDRRPARRESAERVHQVQATGLPFRGVVGCVLSNELVDSFPVHRFEIRGGEPRETYLSVDDGRYVEVLDEPSTPLIARRLEGLAALPAEGHRGEVSLELTPWAEAVAAALDRGFAITIDYGHEADDLYSQERAQGTLQTFHRHTDGAGPYERIGTQDITAHVDFSALVAEGEAAGLRPLALTTQALFLRGLGFDRWRQRLGAEGLTQQERDANRMGMLDLVRLEGLGGFKVLVQEKGTGITDADRLSPASDRELPLPLLGPDHLALMEARYPHAAWDPEDLWPWRDEPP